MKGSFGIPNSCTDFAATGAASTLATYVHRKASPACRRTFRRNTLVPAYCGKVSSGVSGHSGLSVATGRNVGVIRLEFRHDPSLKCGDWKPALPALRVDNCSLPTKLQPTFWALNQSSLILKGKPHKATLRAGWLNFQHI